jgi:hypothetical protein
MIVSLLQSEVTSPPSEASFPLAGARKAKWFIVNLTKFPVLDRPVEPLTSEAVYSAFPRAGKPVMMPLLAC